MNKYFDEVTKKYHNKIIEERTINIKKEILKDNNSEIKEFMSFNLTKESIYAISYEYIYKIINDFNLVKIPFMPTYIHGVINYRGEILTVLNLHHFFSYEFDNSDKNQLIIISHKNNKLGLLVNKVKGFCRYNTEMFAKPFYSNNVLNNKFISSIYENEVLILNIEEIFADPNIGL